MGPFELPDDHQPGMRVPKGGSSCANCRWVRGDGTRCANPHYQDWAETDRLPAAADSYCSDWWQPQEEGTQEQVHEAFSRVLGRRKEG